jgi:hypothetical protein
MTFHFFHIRYIVILGMGLNLSPGAVSYMSEKQILEAFLQIPLCGTNKSYSLRSCRAGFLSALVCHAPFSFRLLVIHKKTIVG